MFEIKARDLLARVGKFSTKHGTITTPAVLPVINPNKVTVPIEEIKGMGGQAIITNSYIIWKSFPEEAVSKGVHNLLDFHGPIMTDSGAYQFMEYGNISVSNQDIIDFQHDIGVDIGVILDHPTASRDLEDVKTAVAETIQAAEEAVLPEGVLWAGPVQGTGFPELQKKCAKAMAGYNFAVHPVGSIVPRMIEYDFRTVVQSVVNVRKNTPPDRLIHAFGAGHPMFFALLAAAGADLFDSAAYALYARDGRYLTEHGTFEVSKLTELPCSCPVCSASAPKDLSEDKGLLARHNLHATFKEIRTVRQAIRDNSLFELIEERVRAHPKLVPAFSELLKEKKYLDSVDWFPKRRVLELSEFTKLRPDIRRARKHARVVQKELASRTMDIPLYGKVPFEVLDCYPFSQTVFQKDFEVSCPEKVKKENKVRAASVYWLGVDIFPDKIRVDVSRKTNRIRAVYSKPGRLLATFRASDFYIILHEGARALHKITNPPENRVVLADPNAIEAAREGGTVFAKFVSSADKNILPGQQVLVTDPENALLASGTALLNAKEMLSFSRGPAVDLKWHIS